MSEAANGFLAAMGELYSQSLAAWQGAARSAFAPSAEGARPAAMPGPLADFAAAFSGLGPGARPGGEAAALPKFGSQAELLQALGEAWMIAAGSAMRYGQTMFEVQSRYQGNVMRSGGTAPLSDRDMTEHFRAFLREAGEAASRETRRLQMELDMLGEKVARAADQANPAAGPLTPRPYKAKP
jgi:hypothetical protein